MGAVRKTLIPLAIRLGVSDAKESVYSFFKQMQEEVLSCPSLPPSLPPNPNLKA